MGDSDSRIFVIARVDRSFESSALFYIGSMYMVIVSSFMNEVPRTTMYVLYGI
jgi:hypothetical protein